MARDTPVAHETVCVDPPFLRIAGGEVADIGKAIARDFAKAKRSTDGGFPSRSWAVVRAAATLDKLWQNYLTRLGSSVSANGDRLGKIADAYEQCDAEAAQALGVALPKDGPVVKNRPGRPPV